MTGKPVRRRMFDRRSGVDRRRADVRIYWPDRRRRDRRSGGDRRGVKPVPQRQRVAGDTRRVALAARDWLRRLTRSSHVRTVDGARPLLLPRARPVIGPPAG